MKISAKNKDCRLWLKVKTGSREVVDLKELDRFSRVYMRCFLKPKVEKKNQLEYSGPMGISLLERMKKPVTKRDFLFIIGHIVVAVQKLQSHRFPLYHLNMTMSQIYINETTKELQFLYVPLMQASPNGNLLELFNAVIYAAHPAAEADMDYVSRFHYFMQSMRPFDINKVEQFIQMEDRTVVANIKKHNAGQSGYMTSKPQNYYSHMEVQNSMSEDTALLDAQDDATGLLQEEEPVFNPVQPIYTPPAPVYTPPAEEEATGLLQEEEPVFNPVKPVYTPPAPVYTPPAPVYTPPAEEESTGLLQEEEPFKPVEPVYTPPAPVYTPPTPVYTPPAEEDATGLLQEEEPVFTPEPPAFVPETPVFTPVTPVYTPPIEDENATGLLQEDGFEEEGTMLLVQDEPVSQKAVLYPELRRVLTGEIIPIRKPVFRLGKERSYVDYFVTNNNAVSRSHADIVTRDSGYFVIDLNSKNRTYINNVPLLVQVETEIRHGDSLRLGNEEFVFQLNTVPSASPVCPKCKGKVRPGAKFCTSCGTKLQQ